MAKKGGPQPGSGRPKGYVAIQAELTRQFIAAELAKHMPAIVDKAIEQAKNGDKYAREWLTERSYGRVPQAIEMSGKVDLSPEVKEVVPTAVAISQYIDGYTKDIKVGES